MSTTNYCECDNTHEAAGTVCQYCWEKGIRTLESKIAQLTQELEAYHKFTNDIDDYFEYRHKSKSDQKQVHEYLDTLCIALREINLTS